jgi:hypothetical protein
MSSTNGQNFSFGNNSGNGQSLASVRGLAEQAAYTYPRHRDAYSPKVAAPYVPKPDYVPPSNRVVTVNGAPEYDDDYVAGSRGTRFTHPSHNPYNRFKTKGLAESGKDGGGFSTAGPGLAANQQGMSERDKQFAEMLDMNKTAMEKASGREDLNTEMQQQQMAMYAKAFAIDLKNQQTMARQTTA